MKNRYIILLTAIGFLFGLSSCTNKAANEEILINKWQIESFEMPYLDSIIEKRKAEIDTMTVIDPAFAEFMETDNLETIKQMMKDESESVKKEQEEAAIMSSISFLSNHLVVFHTADVHDTNRWELYKKDYLILKAYSEEGGEQAAMADTAFIEKINSQTIRLRTKQMGNASYINLRPFTKEDSLKSVELLAEKMLEQERMLEAIRQQRGE